MNNPLLFIQSVSDDNNINSNQEYYDSRIKSRKSVAKHRLEDIEAMLYYRINVLAEIKTKDNIIEGIVLECNEKGLRIQDDDKEVLVPINIIENINILKL